MNLLQALPPSPATSAAIKDATALVKAATDVSARYNADALAANLNATHNNPAEVARQQGISAAAQADLATFVAQNPSLALAAGLTPDQVTKQQATERSQAAQAINHGLNADEITSQLGTLPPTPSIGSASKNQVQTAALAVKQTLDAASVAAGGAVVAANQQLTLAAGSGGGATPSAPAPSLSPLDKALSDNSAANMQLVTLSNALQNAKTPADKAKAQAALDAFTPKLKTIQATLQQAQTAANSPAPAAAVVPVVPQSTSVQPTAAQSALFGQVQTLGQTMPAANALLGLAQQIRAGVPLTEQQVSANIPVIAAMRDAIANAPAAQQPALQAQFQQILLVADNSIRPGENIFRMIAAMKPAAPNVTVTPTASNPTIQNPGAPAAGAPPQLIAREIDASINMGRPITTDGELKPPPVKSEAEILQSQNASLISLQGKLAKLDPKSKKDAPEISALKANIAAITTLMGNESARSKASGSVTVDAPAGSPKPGEGLVTTKPGLVSGTAKPTEALARPATSDQLHGSAGTTSGKPEHADLGVAPKSDKYDAAKSGSDAGSNSNKPKATVSTPNSKAAGVVQTKPPTVPKLPQAPLKLPAVPAPPPPPKPPH